MSTEPVANYPDFRAEWLAEIEDGNPSSVEKGRRFAMRLFGECIDLTEEDEMIYCDGSKDGGIDLAVLRKGETTDLGLVGDAWFLVQSKYGNAWAGDSTAMQEGRKVIKTISGRQKKLSSVSSEVCRKLDVFRKRAGENDRIILTFAKIDPPSEDEQHTLDEIRVLGRKELGPIFDVESICLKTVYDRLASKSLGKPVNSVTSVIAGSLDSVSGDLIVGVTSLKNLYDFMKSYRSVTQNLDQLFDHNVRQFLGSRIGINKAIQETLKCTPEKFGLYNNGITIVVSDFKQTRHGFELTDPYVVNGCQTTRSIWEVLDTRFGAGGTGKEVDPWFDRVKSGVVVVKIAKVGNEEADSITRHTNSQNVVREKDFLALNQDFRTWQERLEDERDLYLEIQRGGWDSRRALQKQNSQMKQLKSMAAAQELLKVYGAGWLSAPGVAFGKNTPFLPGGELYGKITDRCENPFGADDLYAAYLLQNAGTEAGYGRGGKKKSRRQSKHLFSFVMINLLRDVLQKEEREHDEAAISRALIAALCDQEAKDQLVTSAGEIIDEYFNEDEDDSVFNEDVFKSRFGNDLNTFLKWEQLGKDLSQTPKLRAVIKLHQTVMGKRTGNNPTGREKVIRAIGG